MFFFCCLGSEIFQGESYMLGLILLIPLIALACWYFMGGGGKGGDDGWGWDRMGYSDSNTVGGSTGGYNSGSYDTRSFVPADGIDKTTHQRIMDSIQHQQL